VVVVAVLDKTLAVLLALVAPAVVATAVLLVLLDQPTLVLVAAVVAKLVLVVPVDTTAAPAS